MKKIHVVAALIRKGDRIYASQRGYGAHKGSWEFPGGKVEEGETDRQALVREIREEFDTEIAVGRFYDRIEYEDPELEMTMDCYFCSVIQGELTLKEHMDARWLTTEELDTVQWLAADQLLVEKLKKEGFTIRNLIFDVGQILLQYRWKEMFMSYGLDEESSIKVGNLMFSAPFWTDRFDRGIWGPDRMLKEYESYCPEYLEYIRLFMIHAKEMRGEDRTEIWDAIHQLKEEGYGIYLLSNYSDYLFHLHTEGVPFMEDIDGKVVSYEPHAVKPEPEIYLYLRDKYDLKLQECLFFDDRLENIQAGHELGMDGIWITSRKMLGDVLEQLISSRTEEG